MRHHIIFSALLLSFLLVGSFGFTATQQETTSEYVDDSMITTKVKTALLEESSLKSLDIKVVTEKGVVTLSGAVTSKADIIKAGEIAQGVKGVKTIMNQLQVK
jgi:osmotically-inducible protein OsmY